MGYRQIAEEIGYASASGAYEAVQAALSKARAEPAEELRELMLTRLDEMLTGSWEAALSGDAEAVAAVLRIEERRAKLLGLDRVPPLVSMAVGKISVGEADFSKMTNEELREHIRREAETNDNGGDGADA